MGLWLIGACGGIGSTVALGLAALRKGLTSSTGLVSELPAFAKVDLPAIDDIVLGGHEIRQASLLDTINESSSRAKLFNEALVKTCKPAIRNMQRNIRPGALLGAGGTIREMADRNDLNDRCAAQTVERLAADLQHFRSANKLDCIVVVNVASTEPLPPKSAGYSTIQQLRKKLAKKGQPQLPASSIYALAAIEADCPFINFTPSTGIDTPVLRKLALDRGILYMGNDGKTGETLVKSALAPMFAMRNLGVASWIGQNLLGNRDGAVLNDPKTKQAKLRSKDKAVTQILGPTTQTSVSIDYVRSLDDWKVAWDFIHFQGFLETKMSLQFTWQGSDSVLAAPLVIDLARFSAHEQRAKGFGPMKHLAFFFKDPIGTTEQNLVVQWQQLVAHVTKSAD